MKYAVFMGERYYPCGGWHDFVCDFDNYKDAQDFVKSELKAKKFDWAHITDIEQDKIVERFHI